MEIPKSVAVVLGTVLGTVEVEELPPPFSCRMEFGGAARTALPEITQA
jgi:hypothetical protein